MLLLIATLSFLPSCSSDDDEPDNIQSQMIGTWNATSVKFSGDNDWTDITKYPSMSLSCDISRSMIPFTVRCLSQEQDRLYYNIFGNASLF